MLRLFYFPLCFWQLTGKFLWQLDHWLKSIFEYLTSSETHGWFRLLLIRSSRRNQPCVWDDEFLNIQLQLEYSISIIYLWERNVIVISPFKRENSKPGELAIITVCRCTTAEKRTCQQSHLFRQFFTLRM